MQEKEPNSALEVSELPFGAVQGIAPGGVEAYSCNYDVISDDEYPTRSAFRSYYDGIYMGHKWQCVEFARRWLYINKRQIFDDVSMAYEIFNLTSIRDLESQTRRPLSSFANGSKHRPQAGGLLVWDEGGEFEKTGHVAIITEVTDDYVRVCEQNVEFTAWAPGSDFAREIPARVGEEGDYWLRCSYQTGEILGWVLQTDQTEHAIPHNTPDRELFNLHSVDLDPEELSDDPWLNIANPDEEAYVDMMGGHKMLSGQEQAHSFYIISNSAQQALASATDELHGMFMHATDYVLRHPHLLEKFDLPDYLLPRIKTSWENRIQQMITSRFDFCLKDNQLKVYEYNCDSASCYMEAGKIQRKWADHADVKIGLDAGQGLFQQLMETWEESEADQLIHILQDDDPEETYHALFMKDVIESAGYNCVRIVGLDSLYWDKDGKIIDPDKNPVKWVWKTWAWETALDQLKQDHDQAGGASWLEKPQFKPGQNPRLCDVLLNREIMVFEPLWTLIPSNKAMLPILWMLFPGHPNLLETSYDLTQDLLQKGYVEKPIVGRCGSNIRLHGSDREVIEQKTGIFASRDTVYQELFTLPIVGDYHTQLCSFTAGGKYAGATTRVDKGKIITGQSDCLALRVLDDESFKDRVSS